MLVRPTSWGRGKPPWSPWTGLDRGIIVSFRREMFFFIEFGDSDDFECVVRRSLGT